MKQKKRWLSLILAVLLVVGLLPANAMANGTGSAGTGGKSIQLVNGTNPTGGIKGYENSLYHYIFYGEMNDSPVKWKVLDDKTNMNTDGLFLLSDKILERTPFLSTKRIENSSDDPGKWVRNDKDDEGNLLNIPANTWQGSTAQEWCQEFVDSNLSLIESAALIETNKTDEAAHNYGRVENILNKDKMFFLSGGEALTAAYGFSTGFQADSNRIASEINGNIWFWWLRSPDDSGNGDAGFVLQSGLLCFSLVVNLEDGARPAFNLNLDSVLFTSAAEGGKSPDANGGGNQDGEAVGEIFETKEYTGTEWKLTLKDSSRDKFSVLTTDGADGTEKKLTLAYMGATTGSNEYVSALITDGSGTITHYGRLKNLNDETMKNGTVEVTLPDDFDSDTDELYVFSEQYNGDYNTDYASELKEVSLTKNAYNVKNNLKNVTSANGETWFAEMNKEYSDTFSATGVYRVPDSINVTVGSTQLDSMDYAYTPADNKMSATLTISSDKIIGDIKISVTATEAKQETPTAVFNATSDNGGNLTNVDNTMSYSMDGGVNWTKITDGMITTEGVNVSGVTAANGIQVRKDGIETASASEVQKIMVTQAVQPTGLNKTDCTTTEQNDGTITGVDSRMEYKKSDAAGWTEITGNTVTGLTNGTYDVRVRATGTVLASSAATVTIAAHSCSAASDDYQSDATHHWKVCTCGNKLEKEAHSGGTPTYFSKAVCADCESSYGEVVSDTTSPTGEISIKENKWTSLLNQITFGKFFKDTQEVTITGTDDSEKVEGYDAEKHAVKVAYYLHSSDKALTEAELKATTFTDYAEAFQINPDNKYVVYARITDHAGNVKYISSDGLVLDATAPVINGLEDSKTYCIEKTFTVGEDYINEVKDNGTPIIPNEKGEYTLTAGTHTITATDKAGNEAVSVTVTVNESHTPKADDGDCTTAVPCSVCGDTATAAQNHSFTDYKSNGDATCTVDGTKTAKCNNAGCNVTDTQTDVGSAPGHDMGEWQTVTSPNCTDKGSEKRTCSKCDYFETKDVEPNGHEWETEFTIDKEATCTTDGSKSIHCKNCEAAKDSTVIAALGHNFKDGVCTVCKEADPNYKGHSTTEDSTWNKGDNGGAVIKVPSDIGDVTEVTIDDKELTEGKDYTVENEKVIIHPDVLEKLDEGKHTVLIRGENGSVEVTLTVAKKADKTNPDIPKTGDNANTTLWCVLMLMSGFALTGVFVYRRKHKRTNG